jgi:dsRNA-specific ribonuclease
MTEGVEEASIPAAEAEYKTVLQEWAARTGLEQPRYEDRGSTGPAHARVWRARVHVGRLTSEDAPGKSKRLAEAEAARLLLTIAAPNELRRRPKPRVTGNPAALSVLPQHLDAITELTSKLRLRDSWAPYVSAALVQRSHSGLSAPHRAACGGLAQLGSEALRVYALACMLQDPEAIPPDPALIVTHATDNATLGRAFTGASLSRAFILDRAPDARGVPRFRSDAIQALMAIMLLAHHSLSALPRALPAVATEIGRALRAGMRMSRRQLQDPKTILQDITTAAGVTVDYAQVARRGPDAEASFRVRARLSSDSGHREATSDFAPSLREAEQAAAARVVHAFDLNAATAPSDLDTAAFVLAGLRPSAQKPTKLAKLPLAPVDYILDHDWQALDTWLTGASEVLSRADSFAWADALRHLRQSRGSAADGVIFADVLQVSDVVARLEPNGALANPDLAVAQLRLLRTATAARINQRPVVTRELAEVAEDLAIAYGRRPQVAITGEWEGAFIEREGTLLALVAETVGRGGATSSWTVNAIVEPATADQHREF